jgi:hypothetical protein
LEETPKIFPVPWCLYVPYNTFFKEKTTMKTFLAFTFGMLLIGILLLGGCSDSSPTQASGSGVIEGQLVAESGTEFAKVSSALLTRDVASSIAPVYPVSGATVELLQDGVVIATTTTDEYGRFRFTGLEVGNYEVRTTANDGSVARYHVFVDTDQTVTVYGRVVSGECDWNHEYGPHWDEMPYGRHWGDGFPGAAPGPGYWHNGQGWCEPQGSGPHGPHR